MDTPRSLSSLQFFSQSFDRKGPRIVASLIFLKSDFSVSSARQTTSERLQNCFDCKIISPHGFVPTGLIILPSRMIPFFSQSLRLLSGSVVMRPLLLNIPLSPDPLFIRATHSVKNSSLDGLAV